METLQNEIQSNIKSKSKDTSNNMQKKLLDLQPSFSLINPKILYISKGENFLFNLPENFYSNNSPNFRQHITKSEFDEFINKANQILTRSWMAKKKYDIVKIQYWNYIISILIIILFFIYFILLYESAKKEDGKNLRKSGFALCIIGFIGIVFLATTNILIPIKKEKNLEEFYGDKIQKLCEETNKMINCKKNGTNNNNSLINKNGNSLLLRFNRQKDCIEILIGRVRQLVYNNDSINEVEENNNSEINKKQNSSLLNNKNKFNKKFEKGSNNANNFEVEHDNTEENLFIGELPLNH